MKAFFLYIPVIHRQVLDLLNQHKETPIWLLDNIKAAEENVYLERDARALSAQEIQKELVTHGFTNVQIVGPRELTELAYQVTLFLTTEDEITQEFLKKYAPKVPIEVHNIFIRWTQKLSTAEHEIPPDRTITEDEFAQEILSELEEEANKSPDWWRQIAAGVVKKGKIVALAHNKHYPSPHTLAINGDPRSSSDAGKGPAVYSSIHAEAAVIAQCALKGIATSGTDMYVTTFPCPTCARSIIEAGIKKLFYKKGYSMLDAEDLLKKSGVEIILVTEKKTSH